MLCDSFFIPLIQLLSSQTIFPSGGSARATICHSLVLILLKIGERLGREKSSVLLLETLRLFFTCFDAVYMQCSPGISESLASSGSSRGRSETASGSSQSSGFTSQVSAPGKLQNGRERGRSNTDSPVASGSRWGNPNHPKKAVSLDKDGHGTTVVLATQVTSHPLSSDSDKTQRAHANPNQKKMVDPSEALEQLRDTFSPAMAHAMYIPFCKLLGQIKLNTELRNTELIEQLAYRYDEDVQQQTRLPSVFLASDNEQSSSSNSESEDSAGEEREEDELVRDVTIKLGPVVALQKKRGLDQDAVNFGRPSWFINLQDEGDETGVSLLTGSGGGGGGGVGGGMEKTGEGLVGTGLYTSAVVASGVGVGGSMESGGRGAGGEEGGGKGWIEGVRGSAMAGILQLIQSRNVSESQQQLGGGVSGGGGAGGRVDSLTRHSVNFDMKFQSAPTQQAGGHGAFDGKPAQLSTRSATSGDDILL